MNVSDTKSENDNADTRIQEVMKCNELTLRGVLYKAETELAEARTREGHSNADGNTTAEQSSQHHDVTASSIAPPLQTKINRGSSRPKRVRKSISHESPVRIVLATHAPMVSESLFHYQRCIDGKNLSILHTTKLNVTNYDDDCHHHSHYHQREHLANIDRSLINRATSFLRRWRLAIQVGDEINCPDYMDEYEHDDEQRGWIKLYAAIVIDVSTDCKTQVPVGDSSADLDSRTMREIKPGEKAIFVHYVGYPKEQNRWIMMSPSEYVTDTDISYHVFPRDAHQKSLKALHNLYYSSNMKLEEALEGEEGDQQDHSDEHGEESSTDDESENYVENNDEDDDANNDYGEDTDLSNRNLTPKLTCTARPQRKVGTTTKGTRLANAHGIDTSDVDTETDEVKEVGKKKSTEVVSPRIGRRSSRIADTLIQNDASPRIPVVGNQPLRKPQRGRRRVRPEPAMKISKPKSEIEESRGKNNEEKNDNEEEDEDKRGNQHKIDIAKKEASKTRQKKDKIRYQKGKTRGRKKPREEDEKESFTIPNEGNEGNSKGKTRGEEKPKEEDEKEPLTMPKKVKHVRRPKDKAQGNKKPKEEDDEEDEKVRPKVRSRKPEKNDDDEKEEKGRPSAVSTEISAVNNITILSNARPGRRERRIAVPRALQLEQEQAIEELQQKRKKRTVDDTLKVKAEEEEELARGGKSQCSKKRKVSIATPKQDISSAAEIKKEQLSKTRKASVATPQSGSRNATEIKKENSAKMLSETPQPGANKRTRAKRTSTAKKKEEPKQKTKKKETKPSSNDEELDFTWICTECREAECITHPDSLLLICEGECNRPFHYPCAGLPAMPNTDEKWICNDCTEGRHKCSCCHTYGVDNDDVFCCSVKGCGLFFHESCLNMYNVEVEIENVGIQHLNGEENGSDSPSTPHIVSRPRFKCPAHMCWTCHEDSPPPPEEVEADEVPKNEKGQKGKKRKKKRNHLSVMERAFQPKPEGRLYRCLECPVAYHISCIPPTARFHELALLCHEHASTCKLPDLELESSFQGQVEADADKRLEQAIKANSKKDTAFKIRTRKSIENMNAFFPGMVGYAKTENERTMLDKFDVDFSTTLDMRFCLPCDFKNEVHSKPPAYRQVHSLRYDPANKPKRKPPSGESCKCKKNCDENCFNRMVGMECIGDGRKGKGEKNPYWNCNCGPECGNRALSQRKFAKCRPQREQGKGWGLITVNGVKKGALVQEYVGSVIDDETKEERLRSWALDHPNDPNFYVMALDSGWFIDAREEANMSRFINHSCDPNCHLVRLNVGGQMRVGVFSIKDIPAGEFLSYDYQFDTKHGEKFLCRCGAKGCRGTMKGGKGPSSEDAEKKTKKQVRLEAKAGYDRDKKFLEDVKKKAPKRLWQVGVMVPGATDGTESVSRGPQDRYRDIALRNRLFLWRNVMRGANFAARYAAFQSGRKRLCSEVLNETIDEVDVLSIFKQIK